jgi:hypothetical protein
MFLGMVLALSAAMAGVAGAHVEVEAEPAQTGAEGATLTFTVEAESSTAGIQRMEVAQPEGFDATGATLASGPEGWTLSETDLGFAVEGAPVPAGEDLVAGVQVAALPSEAETEWKVIVTYSDGRVDRWIDERTPGGEEPEEPAALLTLEPGTETTTTSAPPTTEATTSTTAAASTTTAAAADGEDDDDGGNGLVIILIVVLAAALIGGGAFAMSRRR